MQWFISTTFLVALALLAVVITDLALRILQRRIGPKKSPLPPGPTALPLLGSALSVDAHRPWLTYTAWRKTYGDIIYIRLLDTDVVVLNTPSVAMELLEKRSRIYSDRPFIPTLLHYGHGCNFGLSRYGEHWRLCRRIFQQTFRTEAALSFRPMQLQRARQLICNIVDHSNEYVSHFETFSAAVAMLATYDYEPSLRNDPLVSNAETYLHKALPGLSPGRVLLVNRFPFLFRMPNWFPGSWIAREAKEACEWMDKVVDTPYEYVQKRMESGDHADTAMVFDHIVRMRKFSGSYRSKYETALKSAATSAYLGSVESTSTTLMTFTLAMVQNPHIWQRAQASIDAVVGKDRLPDFDDLPSLPYVEAIVRETHRWRPVVPLLLPHSVVCDDIYEGYHIPKGATIFANAWAMTRDEARYSDAEKFIPERFLDEKGKLTNDDPREFVFGFGRRICPGRYIADASLQSAIATMLSALDFKLAKDADGNDITFEATFTTGISDRPNEFPCDLTLRPHVSKEMLDHVLSN